MTENKTRKPYVRPSMEVINVEPTSILAGSEPEMSGEWGDGESRDVDWNL